ncbi:MAG: dihydroorotase [Chloroflexi bacterium RBG_13_52_14]|nr:MAG: dihydroorotase [Chloroflexi bacterium RBG_13_52_14]
MVKTKRPEGKHENLLIKGGRIIDPSQGIDVTGDLLISDGKIKWTCAKKSPQLPENCSVINARGMVVCPGFIDLHCHLRQPGFEEKETIATGTRAAARGGFTTVCCMPNTKPPIDESSVVGYIKDIAASEGVVRVLPVGCITVKRKGSELADFGELFASGVIAFSDDGSPVMDSSVMRSALEYSRGSGVPIIDHCEDLTLGQDGVMNEGKLATRLALKGIPSAAEESMVARDIRLARVVGGRLHIAHVSTAGSVELIRRAKEEGLAVTAEVTPHHLTLTEEMVVGYNTSAKVNPPLRTRRDIEALISGLEEGVIDAIATDHAPHTAEDKSCDFAHAAFGISGFETALVSLMALVHREELNLTRIISKLTHEPATFLRRDDLGTLKTGTQADVVIFDPDAEWVVNPEEFVSKGKNTPLEGFKLKGKVMATIYGGAVVYSDEGFFSYKAPNI